jgi:hypothetical protein
LNRGSLIISIVCDTVYDVLVGTCGQEEVKVTGTVSMTKLLISGECSRER